MPVFLTMMLKTVGSMFLKWATKEGVEWLAKWALEAAVEEYEAKAQKTPEPDDDRRAAKLREALEKFKELNS